MKTMLLFLYKIFTNTILPIQNNYKCCLLTKLSENNSSIVKLPQSLVNHDNIELTHSKDKQFLDNFFRRNAILRKIIKQYWAEYIYISSYNPDSNGFEDVISRHYLLQDSYTLNYNKTQLNLKEYLNDSKIIVTYINNFRFSNKASSVKYFYRKYLNQSYLNLLNLYKNKLESSWFRPTEDSIIKKLKDQKLPIFIVVNSIGEVLIGEPDHMLHVNKKFLDNSYNTQKKNLLTKESYSLPLQEGYAFINPFDAIEYCDYIKSKYPYSSNELKLKIFVTTMKNYYKKSYLFSKNIHFRLCPDLNEVGKLITQYQYSPNIHFNSKQMYGKNYFQGQPIYFIDPILCTYVNKLTGQIYKRYFPNLLTLKEKEYFKVFTNFKDALSVWSQYRANFGEYSLPKFPHLTIYNLESFLQEYKQQESINKYQIVPFQFVPSYETYQYIKNLNQIKDSKFLKTVNVDTKLVSLIRVWVNRVIWGMLKWYPPSEL